MPTTWTDISNVRHWYSSGNVNTNWDTGYTTYYPDPLHVKETNLIAELNRLIDHYHSVDHISIAETLENARRKGDCSESKYRWIYDQIRRPVPGDIVFRGANCQQNPCIIPVEVQWHYEEVWPCPTFPKQH